MKKTHGNMERRALDLFYAMWTPDLFMKRVEENAEWTLMCPNECPGLYDCYDEEFEISLNILIISFKYQKYTYSYFFSSQ